MRVGAVIGLVGAGVLLAGCGSGDVEGTAAAVDGTAQEPVFSPCDDIPDEALIELGLSPSTESPDIVGVKQPGWKICKWQGAGPALSVFATTYTLDDVRANARNVEFNPVEIGNRQGFTYRETTDKNRRNCDVALASGNGAVLVSVAYLGVDRVEEEPCSVAVQRATRIAPYIPR